MWGLVGLQGVLYSHRSNFLHALMCSQIDVQNLGSCSCFCALVPMFHANAWGLVFAAPLTGARLILPGHCLAFVQHTTSASAAAMHL